MKKAAAAVVVVIIILLRALISGPAVKAESPGIDAQSYILVDSKSGQVLLAENADEKRMFPASTTKIMTAIIALEKGNPDQVMTASQAAVNDIGKDGMHIGIMPGEQIPLSSLLEAMLIRSANETANIIAENISPSRDEFVELMNEKALEIGAVNTHFANPCGQHDEEHYTTAEDLAKIACYAMKLPKFREIVARKDFLMPPTNKHSEWSILATTNDLLKYYSNEVYTVTGIKTGYTAPAGYCLVSSGADSRGMELIAVVLGVRSPGARQNVYKYSDQLLKFGFENFSLQKVIRQNEIIKEGMSIVNAKDGETVDLISESELSFVLPVDKENWNMERKEDIKTALLEAPVHQGDVLGHLEYIRDGVVLGKVNLIAASTVEKAPEPVTGSTVLKGITQSLSGRKLLLRVVIIFVSFILLRLTLRYVSRRRRKRKYLG